MSAPTDLHHDEDLCPGPDRSCPNGDVSWMLARASQLFRIELDQVAHRFGLSGFRDWIVLGSLAMGEKRTQLALAASVGLDKTTLTAILDRLERDGFVVRKVDPRDRRVRVPEATEKGLEVHDKLTACRDAVEKAMLDGIPAEDKAAFLRVLTRLALADGAEGAHGSCM
ncbi:ranscriptional regulator [Actinorhabdospora filicis]|uniref:Ranscriptional regulator n=1 Tax=Actinorhabdospora filicis TaxID=1785913 RepID=A0A9W6SQW8_9ACTN|nr:MarR family winged helix-turn-helix transcriptional regulator [Actinorhabdospora filicis]GLZ80547.1 ranscriptional regulator [Actinorhabdospora filicis]